MKIGIFALQGAVEPHARKLNSLYVKPVLVKTKPDLFGLDGIILPGGESTTMLHLLRVNQLFEPLRQFLTEKPSWGLCAGTILLAKHAQHPSQSSFGVIDIDVNRNAFGRQQESFIGLATPTPKWPDTAPQEAVFIRAPRLSRIAETVDVLFTWKDEPVMARNGKTLVTTFHPELSPSSIIHRYFVDMCGGEI